MKDENGKLSSSGLAVLIVDALVDAGVVEKADFDRAVEVVIVEIDVQEAMGDY